MPDEEDIAQHSPIVVSNIPDDTDEMAPFLPKDRSPTNHSDGRTLIQRSDEHARNKSFVHLRRWKLIRELYAKLLKQLELVTLREIGRELAIGGVTAGCIVATVATHGVAAPIFILVVAVMAWADKDREDEKDEKAKKDAAKTGASPT
jgi:hypothetical protein